MWQNLRSNNSSYSESGHAHCCGGLPTCPAVAFTLALLIQPCQSVSSCNMNRALGYGIEALHIAIFSARKLCIVAAVIWFMQCFQLLYLIHS